ncbi:MAG: hypothetical protein ACXWQ5_00800 [Ktedonobacterales bacterium]
MASFQTEWEDWWFYQHLFEVASNLHDTAKSVIANGRDSIEADDRAYYTQNFVSLLVKWDVSFSDVVASWLKLQQERGEITAEQAEQTIAALELLSVAPREQVSGEAPRQGVIS